jgi:nucleoside-diphosphate-sugar epimerase
MLKNAPLSPPLTLLCMGFGYTAQAIASLWQEQSLGQVFTTRRNPDSSDFTYTAGEPFPDDLIACLSQVTHILVSIPHHSSALIAQLIEHHRLLSQVRWLGYLSSTSVYGDHLGDWVDETTPPAPLSPQGQQRLGNETLWLDLAQRHAWPVHIFRCAGIYGPDRHILTQVLAGTAQRIDAPGHVFSRIHRDDLAITLVASMLAPNPGSVYNVADDCPASQREVVEFACKLANLPFPPLISLENAVLSDMGRSFYQGCKRVKNNKIKQELSLQLRYPSYREGLVALQ